MGSLTKKQNHYGTQAGKEFTEGGQLEYAYIFFALWPALTVDWCDIGYSPGDNRHAP